VKKRPTKGHLNQFSYIQGLHISIQLGRATSASSATSFCIITKL
jgi:hypothetical protein